MGKNLRTLSLYPITGLFYCCSLLRRAQKNSKWDLLLTAYLYVTCGKSFAELEALRLVYGKIDYSQYDSIKEHMGKPIYRWLRKENSAFPEPIIPPKQERGRE